MNKYLLNQLNELDLKVCLRCFMQDGRQYNDMEYTQNLESENQTESQPSAT